MPEREQSADLCPGCGLPEPLTLPPYCARCNLSFLIKETLGPVHFLDMTAEDPHRAYCGRESEKIRFTGHNSRVECEACIAKMRELGQAIEQAYERVLNRPNRQYR